MCLFQLNGEMPFVVCLFSPAQFLPIAPWSRVCPVVHRMIYIDYISVIQEMIGWFQMFSMNWVDKTEWTRDHGTNSTSFFFLLLNKLTYLLIMFWISMEAYYLFLFFPNRSCCPITFHDWLWNSWTSYRINQ